MLVVILSAKFRLTNQIKFHMIQRLPRCRVYCNLLVCVCVCVCVCSVCV